MKSSPVRKPRPGTPVRRKVIIRRKPKLRDDGAATSRWVAPVVSNETAQLFLTPQVDRAGDLLFQIMRWWEERANSATRTHRDDEVLMIALEAVHSRVSVAAMSVRQHEIQLEQERQADRFARASVGG